MGKLIYIGQGMFMPGIPARDLSPEEVEALGGEKAILKTGIYKKAAPTTNKAVKPSDNKAEESK